jgi:hypothetical protein
MSALSDSLVTYSCVLLPSPEGASRRVPEKSMTRTTEYAIIIAAVLLTCAIAYWNVGANIIDHAGRL